MSRKAFLISVDFDVHAVTCPGVWLCPKGVVVLRVAMFGLCENSRSLRPCFPLLFHERFRFRRLLKSVSSLTCLQEVLKYRNLHMQLVHLANGPGCCPATVLATFRSPLVDVFYPSPNDRGLNVGVDVDLLLKPASAFPGIISPKAEISTRVVIEEVINYPSPHEDSWIVNPVTISSKKNEVCKSDESLVNRQRPVCHAKGNNDESNIHICCCYNLKKPCCCGGKPDVDKQQKPPFLTGKMRICGKPGTTHDKVDKVKCCKPKKRVRTKTQDYSSDEVFNEQTLKERPQPCNCYSLKASDSATICDCILCKKYNDYFPAKNDVIDTSANSYVCCTDPCKKGKSTVKTRKKKPFLKKRVPLKLLEQKNKGSDEIKEVSKTPLPKSIIKQVSAVPKSSLSDDCHCHERSASIVSEIKSDHLRKNVGTNTECPCKKKYDELSERGKLDFCDCKCGIISCPQQQRNNICAPSKINHNLYLNKSISISPQNKSHRQIFYSSLEEYYKKLYDRARERSVIEEVQACA